MNQATIRVIRVRRDGKIWYRFRNGNLDFPQKKIEEFEHLIFDFPKGFSESEKQLIINRFPEKKISIQAV